MERLRRKQGKREEPEEGGKPTQLVVLPPWNYAPLGAPGSADHIQRIAVCVIQERADNQRCRDGFLPPLGLPRFTLAAPGSRSKKTRFVKR